ncbi:MAG TPA: 23S rRNA (adenine(2503)-C(2))-methyltransferase RlmN [Spirochaetota bacterium]|nr:23S rRNA (adenine(2503)-C(2))-methyltransferase RlmN [Spirochaetota bacterium]HPN11365.1 23S rRNA (adenine(2503)-C(2))-methyltransferase RlmN [Spirochaetota bacterium]
MMDKRLIKNYTIEELEAYFTSAGERPFRARQLMNWLYEKNVDSFEDMTNFSKELRARLDGEFSVNALGLAERQVSAIDGTEKYLFRTRDGNFIESVLIRNEGSDEGRLTACLSSQAGCAMGCRFCETAKLGFIRNLEAAEIIDQLCQLRRISGVRNNNIVFMGMGEPFMNYDNVMRAAGIMNYSFGFHVSVRKITVSTAGVRDGIERFIDERQPYNLAISLNDTVPEKRERIMPVERRSPFAGIAELLNRKFPASRNRLTVAYVMRKDNISSDDAKRLKKMFRYGRIKLNLIPLNRGSHEFEVPSEGEIERFIRELTIMNVPITVRKSFGRDIAGACGQLSGRRYAAAGCDIQDISQDSN